MCTACFQVELYAVITAHGSDDHSCGEFCVTSHHFVLNAVFNNTLVFDSAGEEGCGVCVPQALVSSSPCFLLIQWMYGKNVDEALQFQTSN